MKSKVLTLTLLLSFLCGCKPSEHWAVKYATRNPARYDSLTVHFVRTGGCKADTATVTFTRDSIAADTVPVYVHDTLTVPAGCYLDTVLPNGAHFLMADGKLYLTVPVHDSIHYKTVSMDHYIRDLAEENLLRSDSAKLVMQLVVKDSLISERNSKIKSQASHIRKLQFHFWGLIALLAIGGLLTLYLKIKPKIL